MAEQEEFNLQINMPAELLADIERIGEAEQRTRNSQLIWFLLDGVKRYDSAPSKRKIHV